LPSNFTVSWLAISTDDLSWALARPNSQQLPAKIALSLPQALPLLPCVMQQANPRSSIVAKEIFESALQWQNV
jgi:hypothetical protein